MRSDIFTKNYPGPLFEKHASKFVGVDKYMVHAHDAHKGRVLEVNCEGHESGPGSEEKGSVVSEDDVEDTDDSGIGYYVRVMSTVIGS
eukprot:6692914-Ditylum_brightwellii.AAC.1